jgi:beta-phosphoglucomutase
MNRLAVIFDMDGVLADSYQPHFESWRRTAAQRGLSFTEEMFARTFGQTNRDIVPGLWPGRFSAEEARVWGEEKEEEYRRLLAERFPVMAGASELLRALHAAGFAIGVGSSGPRANVDCLLRGLPGAELFAAVVSGCDVKHGKPEPEIFELCARRLGLAAACCAVVEDSLLGLEAARRAGMAGIALTGTTPREKLAEKAGLVVESLLELTPERIRRLMTRDA